MPFVREEVALDSSGVRVRARLQDGNYYTVSGGRIKRETNQSGNTQAITVEGEIAKQSAPATRPGETVQVWVVVGQSSAKYPAETVQGTRSNPDVFRAVKGQQPAGNFGKFGQVKEMLEDAEADGEGT